MRRRCTLVGIFVLVDLFGWIGVGMFGFMILASSSGCVRGSETDDLRFSLSFRALDLGSAPGSGEPNLTTGPDGVVYICWIESGDERRQALRFATYRPGADAWSAPRTIAQGENWFVNWADFPSLAVGEDGQLIAHWLVRTGGQPYAYGIMVSHSTDGGRTWSRPKKLHEDGTPTEHGFVSLLPMRRGEWLAVWLDGRRFAAGKQEMTLRARLLRFDGTWGPEMLVDELVCDCCQTSAVRLAEDRAVVVYRDRSPREVRDIFVVRYEGGAWSAPRPVHGDDWRIPACPVNGPSIDARGERAVVAWFTAAQGERRVEVAFSSDGGRTFAPPVRIDRGAPLGRVDTVMLDDGSALVSWMEAEEGGGEAGLFIRRAAPDGGQSEPVRVVSVASSRASGFPRMVRSGSRIVIAWTEVGERRRVRTALATWR